MKVAIIGASSRIGMESIPLFLEQTDAHLNLFLRDKSRLNCVDLPEDCVTIFEGSAASTEDIRAAVEGVDYVFASLAGDMDDFARAIIEAMDAEGVSRLSFVTTLGILDEVPGEFGVWNNVMIGAYFPPYIAAAQRIEASDLDYTILRPAWLTNEPEIDFEITTKDEPFKGTEISRRSVAQVAVNIAKNPAEYSHGNIGINKPGTDGPKPAFM